MPVITEGHFLNHLSFYFSGHCNLANYSQPGVRLDSNFVLQEKIKNHDLTQQQRGLFVRRHSQNNSVLSKKFLSYLAIVDLTMVFFQKVLLIPGKFLFNITIYSMLNSLSL